MSFTFYTHTQRSQSMALGMGTGGIIMLSAATAFALSHTMAIFPFPTIIALFGLTLLSSAFVFRELTIQVDPQRVTYEFGFGVARGRILIADIESCRAVRNPWWYGFGVHFIPGKGILYNIGGLDAVEIHRRGARMIRLGTDRPAELEYAIRDAVEQNRLEPPRATANPSEAR